nr:kinin-potentiating fraction F [Agkistrodon piscivorus piscivorus]
ELWPRPHIPP